MASSGDMTEQQVKEFIKCLITANPVVLTIQSLQKDYREMIGTSIPYHKFGYNSVEHFLKSIPDTCVVHGTGAFAQVTLVPSVKSAHINQMVTSQKVASKGKRKFTLPRRRNTTGGAPIVRGPPNWQLPSNYSFSPNLMASSSFSMGQSSVGTSLHTTNPNYPNRNIAPRFERLQNTTASIKNTNIDNTNTGVKQTPSQNVNGWNVNRENLRIGQRSENTEEKRSYILEQNKLGSRKVKERLDNLIQQRVKLGNVTKGPTTPPPKNQETEVLNNSKNFNMPDNPSMLVKNALQSLNINNDCSTQEYVKETSDSQEDRFFNQSQEKLNNLLFNFKSISEEVEEDTSNVPKRVQSHLRTLISQFNDGIWCGDVPAHYKRLFKKELMYMEYGYTSLIEMCVALKHIFHYVRPGRDDFKLYDRSKPLPEGVEKFYTMASYDVGQKVSCAEALPDLDWADFKGHIPDDVFKYGNEIQSEFLPVGTKVESIFDVVVVEIYDPSKFWFYLGTSDKDAPLDHLMDSMQTFYNQQENAKEYAVPPGALTEGLYCVQVIYGEYHRARIVRVLPDCPDYVRVYYIDYGTVCKVPIKGICFLHNKFAELNAQAIRCRLANIVPNMKGHPWPRSTSDRFRELVNRRDTKIKISYIDWNEEYVCVFLADVTDDANVLYINETLVKERHALWDGETQVVPFVLPNFKCKVQNVHLFPTFLELENGLAPNSGEMYSLEEIMAPLQFCLPQYFEPNEQIFCDNEDDIEELDKSFVETVKTHRKCTPLSKVDVSTLINPPPIDFDIFGDLKDDIMDFCKSLELEELKQGQNEDQVKEEEMFCDSEEAARSLERYKDIESKLEELEPIRLIREDKELSGSIIEKLEKYSLLNSDNSSGSERSDGFHPDQCQSPSVARQSELVKEELLSPQQLIEDELSTIFEQSEIELDASEPESPQTTPFGFGLYRAESRSDFNIFDDPENFDRTSEVSEQSESGRPVSPESFLRNVEGFCRKDLEEDVDVGGGNSTPETAPTECPASNNPFKFDINSDLKEAFKTFLQSQKKSNLTITSDSSRENSSNSPGYPENVSCCEESFLKYDGQKTKIEGGLKDGASGPDLPFKSNLEETRKSFVSTLSSNNPFRPYLEVKSGETTDYLSTVGTDRNITESTALGDSAESTGSSSGATNLLEINIKFKDVPVRPLPKTSDSEESDYKEFIPRNSQNPARNAPNQDTLIPSLMEARGMGTPPRVATPPRFAPPPRMFNSSGYMPAGYPQYPQWSNGNGYPVPQYPQWSAGGNYPAPYPSFPHPRDTLRPPPGFAYQGPPQGFSPYMAQRMVPAPPMFPPSGPAYYEPPRLMVPPLSTEMDFYERYNKNVANPSK